MTRITSPFSRVLLPLMLCSAFTQANAADVPISAENGTSLCQAVETASAGDTILVSGRLILPSTCAWTVPNVVIRGTGDAVIVVADGDKAWTVAAPDVRLENLAFESTTLRSSGGNLSAVNIRVSNASTGLQTVGEGGVVSVLNSSFTGNERDLDISEVDALSLTHSTLSSAGGVISRARENEIARNRFEIETVGHATALVLVNGSKSSVTGNVFFVETPDAATLLQLSGNSANEQEVSVERNTFVSHAVKGVNFVDIAGESTPRLHMERNIFWGDGGLAQAEDAVRGNYIGQDAAFAAHSDFRVTAENLKTLGAEAEEGSGFPLAPAAIESSPASSLKAQTRSAVAGLWLQSVALQSTKVLGSASLYGNKAYLNVAAPAGGIPVTITSSNPAVVQVPYPTVNVAAGSTTATFALKTIVPAATTAVTITVTANGTSLTAVMTVGPTALSAVTPEQSVLGSGMITTLNRVAFDGAVPTGGVYVNISASNPALAAVTPTAFIPAGSSTGTFQITAGLVTVSTPVTIYASYGGVTVSSVVTIAPATLKTAAAVPTTVTGGAFSYVKFTLTGPAPGSGLVVGVTSSNPSLLPAPATATAAPGSTATGIYVRTAYVNTPTNVVVTGSNQGVVKSAMVTLVPVALGTLLPSATAVVSGTSAYVEVRLNGAAPTGGFPVALSSTSSAFPVPSGVTVPAGASILRVYVTPGAVSAATAVTVTGTANGVSRSTSLTVNP